MEKKSNYKFKQVLTIMVMMKKVILEWSLENLLGRNVAECKSDQEDTKALVVVTEDLDYGNGLESTNFVFVRIQKLLGRLSKEHREMLEREVLSINDIFSDRRFIKAYFYGNHEDVIDVIENMYFECKMNARMLRTLVEVGLIELTPKDHQRFGEIRLLYSWDDPYELQFYKSEEELLEAFKSAYGIK